MSNLILLVICFVLGVLLRRGGRLPEAAPAVLNAFIIHVSLPALVLLHVHDLHLGADFGLAASMAWLRDFSFCWGAGLTCRVKRPVL